MLIFLRNKANVSSRPYRSRQMGRGQASSSFIKPSMGKKRIELNGLHNNL